MQQRDITFEGHAAIELLAGGLRMIIVHDVGPRIAWLSHEGGENLLYWDTREEHTAGAWRLYGGHRLWVTRPLADESGEVQLPDNARCEIAREGDQLRVTAPPSALGIEKTLVIRARPHGWRIEHLLRNTSRLLWSGGAWPLTCTLPLAETVYRIPLGGGPASWDVTTLVVPHRWGGTHTSRLDDPQLTLTHDALELRADRDESKRMVSAPQGVIEMADRRGLFRKVTAFDWNATYPLGTNLALYAGPNRFMVEMESMSPVRTLVPGASLSHIEDWTLESL